MNTQGASLEPGTKIKAGISTEQVIDLVSKYYGLQVTSIRELNGYDDKNFFIQANCSSNPHISTINQDGYIFKILNKLDSKDPDLVESQNRMMTYLGSRGFRTPTPLSNLQGKLYTIYALPAQREKKDECHILRVLTYQRGKILNAFLPNEQLYYQVGIVLSKMHQSMSGYKDKKLESRKFPWMLELAPEIKQYYHIVKDKNKLNIIETVIDEFEHQVLPQLNDLPSGIVHGDLNEQNILVEDNRVHAILDFGDIHHAPLIFDIAVCICYMILHSKNLDTPRHVLRGYLEECHLTSKEFNLLKICIMARICQSLVLGLHSHHVDPTNIYVLSTQEAGWQMLQDLYGYQTEELLKRWEVHNWSVGTSN